MEELVSIVLGLGALALPVVCLVRGGKPSRYAAGVLLWASTPSCCALLPR